MCWKCYIREIVWKIIFTNIRFSFVSRWKIWTYLNLQDAILLSNTQSRNIDMFLPLASFSLENHLTCKERLSTETYTMCTSIDTSERHDNGNYKLPFWYNKVFIFRSPSIHAVRFDKLKIATACGELAENTLTFIDLISKAVICIYI